MKIRVLSLLFLLISSSALAQVDPAVTNRNLSPTSLTAVGQIFSMSFTVGNYGTLPISGATAATRMQFSIIFNSDENGATYCVPNPLSTAALTFILSTADSPNKVSTSLATYFDINYDPALNAFNFLQKLNTPIPEGVLQRVEISTKLTKLSPTDGSDENVIGAECVIAPMVGEGTTENNRSAIYAHTTVTAAMPVSLVSFTARAQSDRTALLSWSTSWERTNKGYIIERSKDLTSFESAGKVNDVAGSSNNISMYRFVDSNPYRGTSYYRLRQVDVDGRSQTFKAESVVIDGRYGVYPNPVVTSEFTLELDEPANAVLHLYGVNGGELDVSTSTLSEVSTKVKTASKLSAGVYVLSVEERGSIRYHRIVAP